MNPSNRATRWTAVLGALALCAWVLAAFAAQRAGSFSGVVSARWTGEGAGVSPTQLQQAERWAEEDGREDSPSVTLWREHSGQTIAGDGGSTALAGVLEGYGEGADLYPALFRSGGYPSRGDAAGCAVDEALASALWGSTDVLGSALDWEGKTYYVRGVFRGTAGLLLTQAADDDETAFCRMLLRTPGGSTAEAARNFLDQNGWGGAQVLDLPLLSWLLTALAALPGLLLAAALLGRLLGRMWKLRYSPLLLIQIILPVFAFGAVILWGMGFPWEIPGSIIPTRWSDFDFWSRLWGQLAGGIQGVFTSALTRRDLALWPSFLACVLLTAGACGLTLMAVSRMRLDRGRAFILWALGDMAVLFLLAAALSGQGGVALSRGMWLLPLLFLAGDCALRAHERWLRPRKERGEPDGPAQEQIVRALPEG